MKLVVSSLIFLVMLIFCFGCSPTVPVDNIEPTPKDTTPVMEIGTEPQSDVNTENDTPEPESTEPSIDAPTNTKEYESQCKITPEGAEFVQIQYGRSFIDKYVLKDGTRVGPEWMYYDDARTQKKSFSCFSHGKRDGPSVEWDINGKLAEEIYYKDDVYDGSYRIWEDGVLTEQKSYVNGKIDGIYAEWQKGILDFERSYKLGERDGSWKSYYKNGQLQEEIIYKDGIDTGVRYTYYENGAPQTERTGEFENGRFTGTTISWELSNNLTQVGQKCDIKDGVSGNCEPVTR